MCIRDSGNRIAWGRVERNDIELHPAIMDAVEGLGGWKHLGQSKDLTIDRAHFFKLYAQTSKRHQEEIIVHQLLANTHELLGDGNAKEKKEET